MWWSAWLYILPKRMYNAHTLSTSPSLDSWPWKKNLHTLAHWIIMMMNKYTCKHAFKINTVLYTLWGTKRKLCRANPVLQPQEVTSCNTLNLEKKNTKLVACRNTEVPKMLAYGKRTGESLGSTTFSKICWVIQREREKKNLKTVFHSANYQWNKWFTSWCYKQFYAQQCFVFRLADLVFQWNDDL